VEHLVDEGEQLHDSLVKSQVLLAFDEVVILFLVGTNNYNFFGSLLRVNNLDFVLERVDCHIFAMRRIRPEKEHL